MEDSLFTDISDFLKDPDVDVDDEYKLMSPEEYQAIIISLAQARGETGFTEDETVNLVRWCEQQLMGASVVGLLLKGIVYIDDPTGEFKEPVISLTPFGLAEQEKLT